MTQAPTRLAMLAAGATLAASGALAQHIHMPHIHMPHQGGQFERLNQPGRIDPPELHDQHAVKDSPAPPAAVQGRWTPKAPLSILRTEMAWAVEYRSRRHLVSAINEAFVLA